MQLLKKLYQVGGDLNGITWLGVDAGFEDGNCYVLEVDNGLIMFDCGCGDSLKQIYKNMMYLDLSPDQIKYCLLTHPHLDHAGAAHKLKEQGVQIVASKETADAMLAGDERCCGYLYHKTFQPCEADQIVNDNDMLDILNKKI